MGNDRVKTDIKGLDDMLHGGLLPQTANLVEGPPGTGKSTLGMQFIYNGIRYHNEPGIIVTFEEFPRQYYHDAQGFGWDFRIVYLFRWKLALPLSIMELPHHLRHHRCHAGIGVIGVSRSCSAANVAVEAFKVTGRAKILALPGRKLFLEGVVGHSCPKVAPQRRHSHRLCVAIRPDNFEVAPEHRLVAARFPDAFEILHDLLSESPPLFSGKTVWQVNRIGNVAEFVEEAALLFGIEPDRLQGGTEPLPTIVDDQFQAVFTTDALLLQDLEELDPFFRAFVHPDAPQQDLATVTIRPDAHGNHDWHFESTFDQALASFSVTADLSICPKQRDPDGIHLKDRRHVLRLTTRIKIHEQVQPFVQGSQCQRTNVELPEQFTHLSQAHGDASQALDLSIHVITDMLMRSNQPAPIDFHATAALTSDTRQLKGYLPPDCQEGLPRTKPVPTEAPTAIRPATTAFTLSEKALRYSHASNVVTAPHYVTYDRNQQCGESCADGLAQTLQRLVHL